MNSYTYFLLDSVGEGVDGESGEVLLRVGEPQVERVHRLVEELGHQLPLGLELHHGVNQRRC